MDNNIIWCGNFEVKVENKEIIDKLQIASDLLFTKNLDVIEYVDLNKYPLYVFYENKEIDIIDFHTFLFFQNYENYWTIFKDLNKINFNIILEDLFSRDNYLEFDKIADNHKKSFFTDLLFYFNKNLFENDFTNKNPKFVKNLVISFAFKEIFKNTKENLVIPEKYQKEFLQELSNEMIVQYNWPAFQKIFKSISNDIKMDFFNENSKLEFLSPILNLGYAYEYKDNVLKYTKRKQLKVVRNNFESFFMKNHVYFDGMPIQEQKALFKIFLQNSRKELCEYIFHKYEHIQKINYSEVEYQELLLLNKRSNLNMDLEKYFLFKKLDTNLHSKYKEKKSKI